eukprot:1001574-Amphidinium_carterae.1
MADVPVAHASQSDLSQALCQPNIEQYPPTTFLIAGHRVCTSAFMRLCGTHCVCTERWRKPECLGKEERRNNGKFDKMYLMQLQCQSHTCNQLLVET